ncbi:hypothetical protein QBC32DRAFT_135915 [Pseudoneurospora amorphoporcata]|uniref:Uncharacterized protein n=1 Tax=Pseudoneurospora amorphoporcata TaxID=241081 RepID=A0AAN6SGU1_9PEZI|nr:hypothetical protein QBC32DRAFT_135915 [Pseudoneurospora amorphoporcata]
MDHEHTLVSASDLGHSQFATSWPAQPTGDPAPTPERPLLGPEQKLMMQALAEYKTNFSLCLSLLDLLGITKKNAIITMDSTVRSFEQDITSGSNEYAILLHTIPAGLHDSLIQGTLAYDYVKGKEVHGKELEERGRYAGVYAVGIAIEGRGGAFINIKECSKVADILQNYSRAYELLATTENENSPLPANAQQVIHDARKLDQACGYPIQGFMLHYLESFGQVADNAHLKALADSFRKRGRALDRLGCDETTNMHQGPLYVGCTTAPMAEQLAQLHYDSDMATVPSVSKFLSLTLGALRYIGLKPYTVEVPILPIWVKAHLPLGERLVTVLASSLITQGGFNGVQAGSRAGTGMDLQLCDEAGSYVAEKTKYFEQNIDQTLLDIDDFDRETEGVEDLERCFRLVLGGELDQRIDATMIELERLECHANLLQGMQGVIQKKVRMIRARHEAVATQYAFNTGFAQLLRSITTRLELDDGSTHARTGDSPPE